MPSDATLTAMDGPLVRAEPTPAPSSDTASPPLASDDAAVNTNVDTFVAAIESNGTENTGVSAAFTTADVFGGVVSRVHVSIAVAPSLPAASTADTRASYTPSTAMLTTVVLLDEHDRVPTPLFTVTTEQYTHRSVRASDKHDVLMHVVVAFVRVGVTSTAYTLGGTVSTTHRTVRGDLSADSVVTAHTVSACGPSERSVSSSDDDDSDTIVHECVSCAAGMNAPLAFTLRTVTL
jgi:hypothetical protein